MTIAALRTDQTNKLWRLLHCFNCASCWTLAEWTRGKLFGGLPWLATGYSQVPGPLAVFAPVVGVFGLTFILAPVAATLADGLLLAGEKKAGAMQLLFLSSWCQSWLRWFLS